MTDNLDAVERAARAMAAVGDADGWVEEIARWESQEQWERDAHPEEYPSHAYEDREVFRSQARVALAAAGAGAEMDREPLAATIRSTREFRAGAAFGIPDAAIGQASLGIADAVLAALAARGDAATPTEVEWGVRTAHAVSVVRSEAASYEAASYEAVSGVDGSALHDDESDMPERMVDRLIGAGLIARPRDDTKAVRVGIAVEDVIARGGIPDGKVQEIRVAIEEAMR